MYETTLYKFASCICISHNTIEIKIYIKIAINLVAKFAGWLTINTIYHTNTSRNKILSMWRSGSQWSSPVSGNTGSYCTQLLRNKIFQGGVFVELGNTNTNSNQCVQKSFIDISASSLSVSFKPPTKVCIKMFVYMKTNDVYGPVLNILKCI